MFIKTACMASTKDFDVMGAGLSFHPNIYSMDLIQL